MMLSYNMADYCFILMNIPFYSERGKNNNYLDFQNAFTDIE